MSCRDAVGPESLLRRLTGRRWDGHNLKAGECSWLEWVARAKHTEQQDGMARWRSLVLRNPGDYRMETRAAVDVGSDIGADRPTLSQLDYSRSCPLASTCRGFGRHGSSLHHRPR